MMKKLLSLAAGASVLMLAGAAYAKDPVALSDKQMDKVTAGGTALANAAGVTLGELASDSISQVNTEVVQGVSPTTSRVVVAQAYNLSYAAGGVLFQVLATSHSDTYASWAP
jgi:hypothetical protein